MIETSVILDYFGQIVSTVAPIAFVVVLVRVGFKALMNVVSGSSDLWR